MEWGKVYRNFTRATKMSTHTRTSPTTRKPRVQYLLESQCLQLNLNTPTPLPFTHWPHRVPANTENSASESEIFSLEVTLTDPL
jgi:hypothetical protein